MPCALCSGQVSSVLGTVSCRRVIEILGIEHVAYEELVDRPDRDLCTLVQCAACGFQYFEPSVLGSARFYEVLAVDDYYQPLRWDHVQALGRIKAGHSVLDLGCGDGTFARAAADRGADVVGVDFADSVREPPTNFRFVKAKADLTDDLVDVERASHDVVTAFHVLEHLASPVVFARQAATFIRPGGIMVLSVPNRERFAVDPGQVLDCPPHHQTRWSPKHFEMLGDAIEMTTEAVLPQRLESLPRLVHRLLRRSVARRPTGWNLPRAASAIPLGRVFNEMNLVAIYRRTIKDERSATDVR